MGRLAVPAFAALLLLVVPACAPMSGGPGRGEKLIDVELATLDGKTASLQEMTRGKVAVFKFGATWCEWCNRETPVFNQVASRYPKDLLSVFQIDVDEPAATVEAHLTRHATSYPTLLDPQGKAASRYNVSGIPVVIVAGPDGSILYRGYYTAFDELNRSIAPAVQKLEAERKGK